MSYPYIELGDIEAACIQELAAAPQITGFAGGAPRISGDIVGYSAGARWIMVTREGGNMTDLVRDLPRVDFQVYAESRTVAQKMAQVAQAVIFAAIGKKYVTPNLQITNVKVETGIFRVPDKETGSPRYIFSLRLTCVPL